MIKFMSIVCVCYVFSVCQPNTYAQLLPFIDDFSDGDATDGIPGTWIQGGQSSAIQDASSGDFVITASAQSSSYVQELIGLRDVSIETQVTFSQTTNDDFANVWARGGGEDPNAFGSYWGGIRENGLLGIGRENSNGSQTTFDTIGTTLDPINGDVLLRFEVIGNQISLFAWQEGSTMPASPQLTQQDNVWTAGGTLGLTYNPNLAGGSSLGSVVFRYYKVVPEPSTILLAMLGMTTVCCYRRRR
jgi:hypothetical protein